MKSDNEPSIATAKTNGMKFLYEYIDDENESTSVYGIDRIASDIKTRKFYGIAKRFSVIGDEQYETIVKFWEELSEVYPIENLFGIGTDWKNGSFEYAIGIKNGIIPDYNKVYRLPTDGWKKPEEKTDDLYKIYSVIWAKHPLFAEIETFDSAGNCRIEYLGRSD